jgi:DNA-binding response OmpR family regulator
MKRALVIAETSETTTKLCEFLRARGIDIITASAVPDATGLLYDLRPDVTILDREVTNGYSLEMIPEIVRAESRCVIISTRNEVHDRVIALQMGADDYVGKPIDNEEVYLRVRNILRYNRDGDDIKHILNLQGIKVDLAMRVLLKRDGTRGPAIRDTELSLLRLLAGSVNRIVSREALFACMHEGPYDARSRTVDVGLSRLRIKLKATDPNIDIRSVRSAGYILLRGGENVP